MTKQEELLRENVHLTSSIKVKRRPYPRAMVVKLYFCLFLRVKSALRSVV